MTALGRRWPLQAVLATLLPVAAVAAGRAGRSPTEVVRAFYAFHFAHDMAFTRSAVRRRAAWLAPDLLAMCRAYFAKPDQPDEVPDIDGDPFTDSQEYPRSFRVGTAAIAGDTARVRVTFVFAGGDRRGVTVVLTARAGSWLIWDVEYGAEPSLRKLLAGSP
jgi:hypothetical protein